MRLADELGKRRQLMVVKKVDFGVYLGTNDDKVLLPKKKVPKDFHNAGTKDHAGSNGGS